MNQQPAVEFHDVSLRYRIMADRGITSLKEMAIRWMVSRIRYKELVALSSVTFSVSSGHALGVIGHNGAGKSTLLRVAAGILRPTKGTSIVRGRQAPVIELGLGFEAELSGRENIFFNGALLGRTPAEMADRLDEIVAFADLAQFIDQPLRTYSTGMVARLAFSVAITVDAQILLLDEILSVGDAGFQVKCKERLLSLRDTDITILLVSHDLVAVSEMCDLVLWLDRGRMRGFGPATEVVAEYLASVAEGQAEGGAIENALAPG